MRRPSGLKGEAAKFWDRHSSRLEQDGLLDDNSFDGFTHLCEVHALKCAAQPEGGDPKERVWFIGLSKQYQALMKQFGLLPRDRKRADLEPELDIAEVLGKKMETR